MNRASTVRLRTWMIVVLVIANVLLLLLFFVVLLGGSLATGELSKYFIEKNIYAPPIAALLLLISPFLWPYLREGLNWFAKRLIPNVKGQPRFNGTAIDRFRALAKHWKLAAPLIVVLVALLWTQGRAVNQVCSPDPKPGGPYGSEGIALSVDERFLYLSEGKSGVAVFAALPDLPKTVSRDSTVGQLEQRSLNNMGAKYRL
jgi:hypothetical protein